MTARPITTRSIGDLGEKAVVTYLKRRLYRILKQNYTVKGGEVDIIAERFGIITFVEVKTRSSSTDIDKYGRAIDAVDAAKRAHLRHAASRYLRENPTKKKPRFDIAEVYYENKNGKSILTIRYLKEAF